MYQKLIWFIPCILLSIFCILLLINIFRNSPVQSEDAHLISGISHHRFWNFDLYRVNPPLVRAVAAFPVSAFCTVNPCWEHNSSYPHLRREHTLGVDYANANAEQAPAQIHIARISCIFFALTVATVCYFYALRLYGLCSGIIALTLLCFSPYILGHSATIMPDAHAASLAVLSVFAFHQWLKRPAMFEAMLAGLALGLAELTKFTLLIFYPLFIVMWLIYRVPEIKTLPKCDLFQQLKQLSVTFLISVFIINAGYLFEGTFTPIGQFKFQTALFTGCDIP